MTHIIPSRGVIFRLVVINEGAKEPEGVVLVAKGGRPHPAANLLNACRYTLFHTAIPCRPIRLRKPRELLRPVQRISYFISHILNSPPLGNEKLKPSPGDKRPKLTNQPPIPQVFARMNRKPGEGIEARSRTEIRVVPLRHEDTARVRVEAREDGVVERRVRRRRWWLFRVFLSRDRHTESKEKCGQHRRVVPVLASYVRQGSRKTEANCAGGLLQHEPAYSLYTEALLPFLASLYPELPTSSVSNWQITASTPFPFTPGLPLPRCRSLLHSSRHIYPLTSRLRSPDPFYRHSGVE